jgi:hypothetical protein
VITPCDLCTNGTDKLVAYDLERFCCATRYLFDAATIRREITLAMLSKHHDGAALRAAVESPKES